MVKNPPANAGDVAGASGSTPGLGRSPGGGNGNTLQHACLENPMDREAWWTTVHGITKESDITECACIHTHAHVRTHTHAHACAHMHTHTAIIKSVCINHFGSIFKGPP